MIESWNGTSWSIVPSPRLSGSLFSVSCVSAASCMAAGFSRTSSGNAVILIESWNGRRWSVALSASGSGVIESVSCVSATACIATGDYSTGGNPITLVESWNGTSWSIVLSPNLGTNSYLYGPHPYGSARRMLGSPRAGRCVARPGSLAWWPARWA